MLKQLWAVIAGGNPGSWAILALIALGALGAATASGAYVTHKMDSADYKALQLADATAQTAAVQKAKDLQARQDKTAMNGAVAEAYAQGKLDGARQSIPTEVVKHVKDTVPCISYGLVRVLNGYAEGHGAADESIASGQPDDACAPVSWRAFASDISDDYVTGLKNAEQLNALIANVRQLHDDAAAEASQK
jgi:hypothetical protein